MPRIIKGYEHKMEEPWERVKASPPGLLYDVQETEGKVIAAVISYEDGLDRNAFLIFDDGTSLCIRGFIVAAIQAPHTLPPLGLLVAGGILTRVQAKKLAEEPLRQAEQRRKSDLRQRAEQLERQAAQAREELGE
jgi:hypothetical protein